MDIVKQFANYSTAVLEAAGILAIILIGTCATACAGYCLFKGINREKLYTDYRHNLVRGILLGLELFVAADLIKTVAIEMTFKSVGALAIIILIRTFLNFTLELEITGRWPWQKQES